jgi:DNA-directed RNA polymerase subunit RPC12/RpoP
MYWVLASLFSSILVSTLRTKRFNQMKVTWGPRNMSIVKNSADDESNKLGYELFHQGSVRRFNPSLFAVRKDDHCWFMVELKDGRWVCDCNQETDNCPHVYAVLLLAASNRLESEQPDESFQEESIKCRYCGSPDLSACGFRYNARGITRRYLCNECRRKFSVPYVEPQATLGAPSGILWLLSQVAMLTSKLNLLLKELDDRIALRNSTTNGQK